MEPCICRSVYVVYLLEGLSEAEPGGYLHEYREGEEEYLEIEDLCQRCTPHPGRHFCRDLKERALTYNRQNVDVVVDSEGCDADDARVQAEQEEQKDEPKEKPHGSHGSRGLDLHAHGWRLGNCYSMSKR